MAKKKKKRGPVYLQSQGAWRRDFIRRIHAAEDDGDELQAGLIENKLRLEEAYLKDSIKLLRRFVGGFEASDGYDLNRLAFIPETKLKRVRQYAPIIREETSQRVADERGRVTDYFKVVRPRKPRGHDALQRFTGQRHIPRRKAYSVPVADPQRESVRLVRKSIVTKDKRGRARRVTQEQVEVTRKVGRQIFYNRYFRFPEPPTTFDDVIRMTRKLLRFMPRGWYTVETSNYGAIGIPMRKEHILSELQNRFLVYDVLPRQGEKDSRGLAETVIGYRLIGSHADDADREYDERLTRRMAAQRFRQAQRAANRRRALRRRG